MKKILLLIAALSLLVLSGCEARNYERLEQSYLNNQDEFNQIVNDFLENDMGYIAINVDNDDSTCEYISGCRKCPSEYNWKCSDDKKPQFETDIETKEEVLKNQNISQDEYDKYVNFLKKYHLNSISRNYWRQSHLGMVELGYRLVGLRYESNSENELIQDDEYLYVKKLNDNWYVFERDWN